MKTRHYIELAILLCVLVASAFTQAKGPTAAPTVSAAAIAVWVCLGLISIDLISAVWRITRPKQR